MLTTRQQTDLTRWIVASVLGWGGGLAIGGGLVVVGLGLRVWLPGWVVWLLLPIAGALAGWVVGQMQRIAAPSLAPRWPQRSAAGGAVGAVLGGGLAALASAQPWAAPALLGAGLAAGVALGQRTSRRWVAVNALAGAACGVVGPTGSGAWLMVSCLFGTAIFGVITGTLWVVRAPEM